jgi:hypothetical protein
MKTYLRFLLVVFALTALGCERDKNPEIIMVNYFTSWMHPLETCDFHIFYRNDSDGNEGNLSTILNIQTYRDKKVIDSQSLEIRHRDRIDVAECGSGLILEVNDKSKFQISGKGRITSDVEECRSRLKIYGDSVHLIELENE